MPINSKQTETKHKTTATNFKWPEVERAKNDVKQTFGFIPNFANSFTDGALPGAWNEAKKLRFSQSTHLDIKLKALIALSVAAQIPCDKIGYFEKNASLSEGVTTTEQYEAVTMAAIIRHWSTVLNGSMMDKTEFRNEVDQVMRNIKKMLAESHGKMPEEKMFLVMPESAEETYKDIENTLGFVPKFFHFFSKEGISGAWSEFKGLQLNPYTKLDGKQKELIGLAVAAQIPCEYCAYFHKSAASLNGATEVEMQEAISMAALTRHWSAIFNSPMTDSESFNEMADKMIKGASEKSSLH